jgi:hypothetical protein
MCGYAAAYVHSFCISYCVPAKRFETVFCMTKQGRFTVCCGR